MCINTQVACIKTQVVYISFPQLAELNLHVTDSIPQHADSIPHNADSIPQHADFLDKWAYDTCASVNNNHLYSLQFTSCNYSMVSY